MALMFVADTTTGQSRDASPPEVTAFIITWVLLGLGSFLFFHFNRNAALKRRVWKISVIAVGFIFTGFVYLILGHQEPQVMYILVPVVILISLLNIRMTRFCDSCGKTVYRHPFLSRARFCSHCGIELK